MVLFNQVFAATLTFLFTAGAVNAQNQVCNQTSVRDVDILFLLDNSGSMGPYIDQVRKGFGAFAKNMAALGVNGRFAVAKFGGRPTLVKPFTSNADLTATAIQSIQAFGVGQEASFEAIRAALQGNNGADFLKDCISGTGSICELKWRDNARKLIVLATDEDSDLPTMSHYRVQGQNEQSSFCSNGDANCNVNERIEPSFQGQLTYQGKIHRSATTPLRLSNVYQAELDLTANMLLAQNVTLMALVRDDRNAVIYSPAGYLNGLSRYYREVTPNSATTDNLFTTLVQFGLPSSASQTNTFANFNPSVTLQNLKNSKVENSLQAKILGGNGIARLFSLKPFTNSLNNNGASEVTNYFYASTLQTITNCYPIDACGVILGNNSTCSGCDGIPNSGKTFDRCGVCGGKGDSCLDCLGVVNGTAKYDRCGICNGNGNSCLDCSGAVYGTKIVDKCGVCGGNNSSCCQINGIYQPGKVLDGCNVCGGDFSTCCQINGVYQPGKVVDSCGVCGGNNDCLSTLTYTNPASTDNGYDEDYYMSTGIVETITISYGAPGATSTASESSDNNIVAIGTSAGAAALFLIAGAGYLVSRKRKPRSENGSINSLDSNDNDHFQSNPMFQGNNKTFDNPAYKHKSGSNPGTVIA